MRLFNPHKRSSVTKGKRRCFERFVCAPMMLAAMTIIFDYGLASNGLAYKVQAQTQSQSQSQSQLGQGQTIVSAKPDETALTIYRDDLAFITETRTVELQKGRSTISFEGVSDLMIPQTALLREFGGLTLERNFDYDFLTQASLFEKFVGETVYIHRTNPATGAVQKQAAIIVSANDNGGAVMEIDGQYEAFDCSGLPEKVSFPQVPDGLKALPTLSIDVVADKAGPQSLTISYLASGFDWQADYILRLQGGGKADLAGWLTVTNETEISIKDAPTAIIAGTLQRLDETEAEGFYSDSFSAACWRRGSTTFVNRDEFVVVGSRIRRRGFEDVSQPAVVLDTEILDKRGFTNVAEALNEVPFGGSIAEQEDLGDYKLYRTPNPTTVAAYQTKQVLFLDKQDIDVTQYYVFDLNLNDTNYRAVERQSNRALEDGVTPLEKQGPIELQNKKPLEDREQITVTGSRIRRNNGLSPIPVTLLDGGYGGPQNSGFGPQARLATVRYDIDNKREGPLGEPLPAGTVRVMIKGSDGAYLFLGEDDVRDLAIDLPVEVSASEASAVAIEVKAIETIRTKLARYRYRYKTQFEYRITNANDYPVLVEVTKDRNGYSSPVKIVTSTVPQVEDSDYPKWRVDVDGQSQKVFTATLEWER